MQPLSCLHLGDVFLSVFLSFFLCFFNSFLLSWCCTWTFSDAGSHQQPCILLQMAACLKLVSVLVADAHTPTRTYTPFKQAPLDARCKAADGCQGTITCACAQSLVPVQGHLCLCTISCTCTEAVTCIGSINCTRAVTCIGAVTCTGSSTYTRAVTCKCAM